MCGLCSLAGVVSGGPGCQDLSDPGDAGADAGTNALDAGVSAPPAFSLPQIIQQLRTQWGGSSEGVTASWGGSAAINYYIGGTPYTSGSGEIPYKTTMTSLMLTRAVLAFELWDDLIARDLNQASSPAFGQIQFEYATQTYNANGVLSTNGGTYSGSWTTSSSTPNGYGTANYNITRNEIWLNSNWSSHNQDSDMYFGGYGFQTYMHEIGHSLGLSHPGTYDAGNGGTITYANNAEYAQDNRQYTIMSYFGGYSPTANSWQQDGTFSNWLYSSTPMLHDVAAIQAIYGADMTTRAGDTTYGFNSNAGRDVFDFTIDIQPIVTIWDAGGNDTVDLSGYSANQRIDLNAGTYSDVGGMFGNFAIAFNVTLETAIGGSGSDTIVGNAANNTLKGNGGNDTINGGDGIDTAVFSGVRAQYTLTDLGSGNVRVTGPDGTDTLSNVEYLRFSDVTLPWPSDPDLLIVNFALGSTTASYTVYDTGGPSPASTAGLYLSTDSTITTADTLLAASVVSALSGGGTENKNVPLGLPANLTPGTYYLGIIADTGGQVTESNETNNVSNVIAVILGNASANVMNGTAAGDTMYGLAGTDTLNGAGGADLLTGGANADKFVFDGTALSNAQSGVVDRVTDYDQGGGAFNAAEGDQIDLSAILSAAFTGGQSAGALVRVVAAGSYATLQVDPDGTANGTTWTTLARLDGIGMGHNVNVILNAAQPAGVSLSVQPDQLSRSFDGDGNTDLLWQRDDGTPAVWLMSGTSVVSMGPPLSNPGPSWHAIDSADFNGDGKADVLWQNTDGTPAVWLMNGTSVLAMGGALVNPGPTWHAKAAADFNGDGKADILWQNDSGLAGVWLMDGTNVMSTGGGLNNPGPTWHVVGAGDFNGDGKADILWQNSDGMPGVWLMNGTSLISASGGLPNNNPAWHAKAVGDFDGNGKADIVFQHDDGTPAVWLMDGTSVASTGPGLANPGPTWHIKEASDFNGDGKADLLWQNDNGLVGVWLMNGTGVISPSGAIPDPGNGWHLI
ncbi:MAG: hypothetical protein QOF14_1520 [Hyphomicrobiales bacterium]|jgi:hypothetical protein|nr:hypothetical protein [Hyphomicrobiales bacterium]